jgi:hypothetical protein
VVLGPPELTEWLKTTAWYVAKQSLTLQIGGTRRAVTDEVYQQWYQDIVVNGTVWPDLSVVVGVLRS